MAHQRKFLLFRALFFVMQMPVAISLPYFVLYMRETVGLTPREISYVVGIASVSILLFQQFWGYIADVRVSKKLLIVLCALGAAGFFFMFGRANRLQDFLLISIFYQFFCTPIYQLIHGFLFTHEGSEARFGNLRAYASLGFIACNLVVGIMADRLFKGNLHFIFEAYLVVTAVGLCFLFPIPERPRPPRHERPRFLDVQRHFLARPEVVWFLVMVFFYQAAHTLSYQMQALLMRDMKADNILISTSYSLAALVELPVFFSANRLIRRFGEIRLILFAAAVQTVRWMLVWNADTPEQIILISLSHAFTFGLFYAAAISFMNRQAGPHLKASAQTLFALVYFGLAGLLGNFVGGQVTGGGALSRGMSWLVTGVLHLPDRGGLRNLYVFCSLLALISCGLCLWLTLSIRSREKSLTGDLTA
ncbi:MAG: MFS transporter [Candidatus Sumerlaeaceae bacterium]|nr:MFS transporter [Candidatus Sumerlaeaceae bacterium]